jgi:hypothetical protein
MNLIRVHPVAGLEMVEDIDFPADRLDDRPASRAARWIRLSVRLKGDQIILESRIIAVADVVEAISAHRPYRPPSASMPGSARSAPSRTTVRCGHRRCLLQLVLPVMAVRAFSGGTCPGPSTGRNEQSPPGPNYGD